MDAPLIVSFSERLAAAGYPAMRFNFLYAERGKKAPDNREILVKTWRAAHEFAVRTLQGKVSSWVAAGKSMGGRIASEMVSENLLPVDRLIFLGYPLHRAGHTERLKDAHLYRIQIPMLFFAGTRDALCDQVKLDEVLRRLPAPWELHIIEKGDHSFHLPKATRVKDSEVFEQIIGKTLNWLREP